MKFDRIIHIFNQQPASQGKGRTEKDRFSSLEDLDRHLQAHGPRFYEALKEINAESNVFGWQIMKDHEDGRILKEGSGPVEGAVFTGRHLCNFASYALQDELKDRTEGIDLDVVEIQTDFHAEKWDIPGYEPNPGRHFIFKATEKNTRRSKYYDPTYGQVDMDKRGTILPIEEDELGKVYRVGDGEAIEPKLVTHKKDEILGDLDKYWGLTKEKFQILKKSL